MLGQIRRIRGDFQGAINAYRKEIDLNPENVIPYLNLAFVQNENRNFIEAEISFQKVLAIDHTNVNAWRGLVTTYLGLRDNLKALICVERCAALGDPWGKDEIDRIQKLREHQLQLLSTPMHSTWKNKIQRLKGKYTAEEMAYFIEIALLMDMEVRNPTVKKWNRDIKLQVLGMPTHKDINTLNKSIIELNDLIQRIKITLTPEGPNASIRFTPESTFWKFDPTYVPVHFSSFKLCWNSETIYKAEILISTDGVNQAERSHIIRHELTQSLGFMHNSQKEKNSIFYAGMTGSPDFTDLDIYIISLLYRAEIKHGMLESQIKEIISSIDRSP